MPRKLKRALLIEDDSSLRDAIGRVVAGWGDVEIFGAGTVAEALDLLTRAPPPDLVITDVRLPDASAFEVLEVSRQLSPAPIVVAISGKAAPDEAFRLAQAGVRAYLAKPFTIEELETAVDRARSEAPDIEPMVAAAVGQVPMLELQREVRRVMMKEALAQTEGSRTGAARLLRITRQAVQQMLRSEERSLKSFGSRPPPGSGANP